MLTLGTETALRPYRDAFLGMPIGAVVIERAIASNIARTLRAGLDARGFSSFYRADRGRYEIVDDVAEPDLLAGLTQLASFVSGQQLVLLDACCLRLRRGDYGLKRDDTATQPRGEARRYELSCDLSAASSGEAQVVYARHGRSFFVAPQLSGSVSLVCRAEGVSRYDRYLNLRTEDRVVHRLRLWLERPA